MCARASEATGVRKALMATAEEDLPFNDHRITAPLSRCQRRNAAMLERRDTGRPDSRDTGRPKRWNAEMPERRDAGAQPG